VPWSGSSMRPQERPSGLCELQNSHLSHIPHPSSWEGESPTTKMPGETALGTTAKLPGLNC
jgi:hypothetical protein